MTREFAGLSRYVARALFVSAAFFTAGCASRPLDVPAASDLQCGTPAASKQWHSTLLRYGNGVYRIAGDGTALVVATDGGVPQRSVDGGELWDSVGSPGLRSVAGGDGRFIGIGDGGLCTSSDHGLSFDKRDGPAPGHEAVVAISGTSSYIASTLPAFFASHDGKAFELEELPGVATSISPAVWSSGNERVLVGAAIPSVTPSRRVPGVLRSSDGGSTFTTWQASEDLAGCQVRGLWGRGDSEAYLVASGCEQSNLVLRSLDGGTSFAPTPTSTIPNEVQLVDVRGNARGELVAVGFHGAMYYSNDRGDSFIALPQVVDALLFSVWVGECGEIVAVSTDGDVVFGR